MVVRSNQEIAEEGTQAMIQVKPKQPNQLAMRQLRGTTLAGGRVLSKLDREARAVANTMQAIHGGKWNVRINHENCLVLIVREIEGLSLG